MSTLLHSNRLANSEADNRPLCVDCLDAPAAVNRGLCEGCEARRELVKLAERIARADSDALAVGVRDLLATAIANAELFDDPSCLRWLETGWDNAAEEYLMRRSARAKRAEPSAVRIVKDPRGGRNGEIELDD